MVVPRWQYTSSAAAELARSTRASNTKKVENLHRMNSTPFQVNCLLKKPRFCQEGSSNKGLSVLYAAESKRQVSGVYVTCHKIFHLKRQRNSV